MCKVKIKACVHYFLSNFYFSPNDSPSKIMKNVFYFIIKLFSFLRYQIFLFLSTPLFLPVSHCFISHCFRGWSKINLKVYDVINCLNKMLTLFVMGYIFDLHSHWQMVEVCCFCQQVIHLLWTKCHSQIFADVIVLLVKSS